MWIFYLLLKNEIFVTTVYEYSLKFYIYLVLCKNITECQTVQFMVSYSIIIANNEKHLYVLFQCEGEVPEIEWWDTFIIRGGS